MQLKSYLESVEMSAFDFAIKARLSPAVMTKLVHSQPGDIYLSTALRIIEASEGNVGLHDLISDETSKRKISHRKMPSSKPTKAKSKIAKNR